MPFPRPGSGGGGSISEITSTDDSVTITDPEGPTTDLSVAGGGGLPAWFQSGVGDPIDVNPTVPNIRGGLYMDTSNTSVGGPWVAYGADVGQWIPLGALAQPTGFSVDFPYNVNIKSQDSLSGYLINEGGLGITQIVNNLQFNWTVTHGSPVGVITPLQEGDIDIDLATPAVWMATGVADTDWIALGNAAIWPAPDGLLVDYEFPGSFASAPVSPAVIRNNPAAWFYTEPRPGLGQWTTIVGNSGLDTAAVSLPTPDSDWQFDMNVTLQGDAQESGVYRWAGAVLELASGETINFEVGYDNATNLLIQTQVYSGYSGSYVTGLDSTDINSLVQDSGGNKGYPATPVFLRIVKNSSTSFDFSWSLDGVNYNALTSAYDPGSADVYVGFAAYVDTTAGPITLAQCNYLRIAS